MFQTPAKTPTQLLAEARQVIAAQEAAIRKLWRRNQRLEREAGKMLRVYRENERLRAKIYQLQAENKREMA